MQNFLLLYPPLENVKKEFLKNQNWFEAVLTIIEGIDEYNSPVSPVRLFCILSSMKPKYRAAGIRRIQNTSYLCFSAVRPYK